MVLDIAKREGDENVAILSFLYHADKALALQQSRWLSYAAQHAHRFMSSVVKVKRQARAITLAEEQHDFRTLVELCHSLIWQGFVDSRSCHRSLRSCKKDPHNSTNLTTSPSIGGPVPGWRKRPSRSEPPKEGLASNVGILAWKLEALSREKDCPEICPHFHLEVSPAVWTSPTAGFFGSVGPCPQVWVPSGLGATGH
ncbi:hypothetical protein PGTUg99_037104 [Puccinia graminis f. sp. tritici]|uniref:Uncharacterized protein n=1 Tax=Puccinia graminis f. sp. tritici TaxID=56615 RepID=A0A5B0PMN7_PUCGR|nr:hypothetical protein PGTUg99_037104 [Puccinia graminis f. sp. tritici]